MARFYAILFAYFLSTSSVFASPLETVQELLAEEIAISKNANPADININVIKGKNELLANPNSYVDIISLKLDDKFDNFYCIVSLNSGAAFEINGKFEKLTLVPVLNKKMKRDEVIKIEDISYTKINEKLLARGFITDAKKIVGKSITKTLMQNKPILPSVLAEPKVVKKDKTVKMIYKSANLTIEDNGIALEAGSYGEIIRVKNANSNRVVSAKIINENIVEIITFNQLASNI